MNAIFLHRYQTMTLPVMLQCMHWFILQSWGGGYPGWHFPLNCHVKGWGNLQRSHVAWKTNSALTSLFHVPLKSCPLLHVNFFNTVLRFACRREKYSGKKKCGEKRKESVTHGLIWWNAALKWFERGDTISEQISQLQQSNYNKGSHHQEEPQGVSLPY